LKCQHFRLFLATSDNQKLANVSRHSSLSQADDVSSPYARVHPYDKVLRPEHPYAQVAQPGTSAKLTTQNEIVKTESNESLLGSGAVGGERGESSTCEIAASAAIAGHISASQDLPYMTPPIVQLAANQDLPYITPPLPQTQHFSGDSQDSSSKFDLKVLF
jgi:hypothetical protein